MLIFITRQTQPYVACIFGICNTTTFCGCPDEPSSGRAWIHKKRVKGRGLSLQTILRKLSQNNCNCYYSENRIIGNMKLLWFLHNCTFGIMERLVNTELHKASEMSLRFTKTTLFWEREREREREREKGHPVVYYQICVTYCVPSINDIHQDKMQ